MSTRLTKALEFTNYRVTLNNQQAQLKAKTQSLLSYSINGGTFTIDIPLITFCKQLIDEGQTEVVLLDIYNNPIKVNVEKFSVGFGPKIFSFKDKKGTVFVFSTKKKYFVW